MKCPHCHKELPREEAWDYCPHCSRGIPPLPNRKKQLLFFVALFAPAIITLLVSLAGPHSSAEGNLAGLLFFACVAGGLTCGIISGTSITKAPLGAFFLSAILSVVMFCVCVALCFFGCALSGQRF